MAMFLHMKNLSVLAANIDIRRFFTHYDILENGVHILEGPDPEAFITFRHYGDLLNALSLTGHDLLGQAVKLCIISFSEMDQIIKRRNATIMCTTQMIRSAPMISTSGANRYAKEEDRDHTPYLNPYFDSVAMSNQDYIGHTSQVNLGGGTYDRNEGMDRDCLHNWGQHAWYETGRECRQVEFEMARDRLDNGQYGMVVGYKEDQDNQMTNQGQPGIVDSVPGYIRLDNLPASIGHPELEDLFKYYKMRIAMPDGIIRSQVHGDNSAFIKLSSHHDALRVDALNELEMQGHKVHVKIISAHQYDKVNHDMMRKKEDQDTLHTKFDYITFEANGDAAFKAAGVKQKWNDTETFQDLGEVVEPHCNIIEYTTPRKIQNFSQGKAAVLSQIPSSGSKANIYEKASDQQSLFSRLILGAKSSNAKTLSFIRLSSDAIPDGATASGMRSWLSGQNATSKGAIFVRTSMGDPVCAFIAFENMAHCKRALEMCQSGWIDTEARIHRAIVRHGPEYDIFESTALGNDIKVSKEMRKELKQRTPLEENQAQGKKGKAKETIRKTPGSNADEKNKLQGEIGSGILSKPIIFSNLSNLVERVNAKPGDSKFLCFMGVSNMAPDASPWRLWKQYGGASGTCKGVVVVRRRDANNAWCAVYAYMAFEDPVHRNAAIKSAGVGRKWNARAIFRHLAQVDADSTIMQSITPGTDHELSKIERVLLSHAFYFEKNKESNSEIITKESSNGSNAQNPEKASDEQSIFSLLIANAESPDAKPLYFILISSGAIPEGATASGMCRWLSGPNATSKGAILVCTSMGDRECAFIAYESKVDCKAVLEECEGGWMHTGSSTSHVIVRFGSEYDVFESTEMGNDNKVSEERRKELRKHTLLEVEENQAQGKKGKAQETIRKAQDSNADEKNKLQGEISSGILSKPIIFSNMSNLVERINAKPGNSKYLCFMGVSNMAPDVSPWRLWKQYGGASGTCKGVVVVCRRDAYNAWCTVYAYVAFEDPVHRNAALKSAGVGRRWSARATFRQLAEVDADCTIMQSTTPGTDHELSQIERVLLSQAFYFVKNKESNSEIITKESSNGSNAENPEKASDEQSIFSRLIANAESPDAKPLYFILISSDAIPEGATASGMCRWLSRPNATSKGAILVYTSMGDRECAFIAYESKVDCMAALEECEGGRMRSGSSTSRAIALYGSEYDIFESTEMGNDNKVSKERRKGLRKHTLLEVEENQAPGKKRKAQDTNLDRKIKNKTTRPKRLTTDHNKSKLEGQIVTMGKISVDTFNEDKMELRRQINSGSQEAMPTKMSNSTNYSSPGYVKICNLSLSVKFQELESFFQEFALVSDRNGIILKAGQHSSTAYVKFNSLPDGLKLDSLDCSMLKGEAVAMEMISPDMFEHEKSNSIEGAETQLQTFTDLNSTFAPHVRVIRPQPMCFIKFDHLADDVTACAIWDSFGGAKGTSKGVRLVRHVDDRVAFAYVAFDNEKYRNSAMAINQFCKAVSSTKTYRHLANLNSKFRIFEATETGRDREISEIPHIHLSRKPHVDSPVVNLSKFVILSDLVERANAKLGDSKYLCFMHVSTIASNVSPLELWNQYGRASGKCNGVVVVRRRDDSNVWCTMFAYLAFEKRWQRNAALKAAGLTRKWSARETFQRLAQVDADCHIFECTKPGKVHELSKGEQAMLCQTFHAEQNKESNAEIINKESSNASNDENLENASDQQSIFSRLIMDAESPDAKPLYFILIASDAIPEDATGSGMCRWLSGPDTTSKGAILVRTSMGDTKCAFIAFESKLHCKAALEEREVRRIYSMQSTRRAIVRYGSEYDVFESTETGNDIKVSEEKWKKLQQVTPSEFEQNEAHEKKRRALLCQTFFAEQNKELSAEIITKESSNTSNDEIPEKASDQQSIFSRLIMDAESPDAKPLYFIRVASDSILEGATGSGMCRWLSGPATTSKGAILMRTSMGYTKCAFVAFESKLQCKAASEEHEVGRIYSMQSTRRAIVRCGSEYDAFESTEMGNDIKVSEEKWKELQQVTPLEGEQNQAHGKKRKAQDTNLDEIIDKRKKVEEKLLNQDTEVFENQEAGQNPNVAVPMNEDDATMPPKDLKKCNKKKS